MYFAGAHAFMVVPIVGLSAVLASRRDQNKFRRTYIVVPFSTPPRFLRLSLRVQIFPANVASHLPI